MGCLYNFGELGFVVMVVVFFYWGVFFMLRREFLKRVALGVGGIVGAAYGGGIGIGDRNVGVAGRPNIVFILADDLDFDEIGVYDNGKFPCRSGAVDGGYAKGFSYGNSDMGTANIDSLAKDGAVANRFYVTTSICTPSRYSFFTGKYASRCPAYQKEFPAGTQANLAWQAHIAPDEDNVFKQLQGLGYVTGMFGKWHNGVPAGRVRKVRYDADPLDGEVQKKVTEMYETNIAYLKNGMGFDSVGRMHFSNKEELGLPKALAVHNLEWVAEGAEDFIEANKNRPFMLYLPLTVPHGNYNKRFLKSDVRCTPAGKLATEPKCGMASRAEIAKRMKDLGVKDMRLAMAAYLDEFTGAVMKKIEDSGLRDNTLFIFTSDHQARGKFTCYESSRVPFIARWPKRVKAGSEIDGLCANIDVPAMLLEAAGGEVPASMIEDGVSFYDQLVGKGDSNKRESLFLECANIRAVVTERYKYIANRPGEAALEAMAKEAEEFKRNGKKRRISWDGTPNPHPIEWGEGVRYNSDADFKCYFDVDQLYHRLPHTRPLSACQPSCADALVSHPTQHGHSLRCTRCTVCR